MTTVFARSRRGGNRLVWGFRHVVWVAVASLGLVFLSLVQLVEQLAQSELFELHLVFQRPQLLQCALVERPLDLRVVRDQVGHPLLC